MCGKYSVCPLYSTSHFVKKIFILVPKFAPYLVVYIRLYNAILVATHYKNRNQF